VRVSGTRYVALLRGVNLGRERKVGMAELRTALTELGHADVQTYLQSGNALFTSAEPDTEALELEIEKCLAERYDFDIPCLVRPQEELRRVVAGDPFGAVASDKARYAVYFLSDAPDPAWAAGIDRASYEPELFQVGVREIYVWLPGGIHSSRLVRQLSQERLGVTVTARNWNTVTKLATLP
jgi:uncharacterized protein (DUF1697 family)